MNAPCETGHFLHQMRQTAPLVQCITNYVAMNTTANVLLAAGASPAMVHAQEEVAEFAALAQALCINIGTLDAAWATAMGTAAAVMQAKARPWVLDPVGVGATAFRRDVCARLLAARPAVIRGNASEIMALAGAAATGRGADAADPVTAAEPVAKALAARTGAVVAVSGPVDFVTDGRQSYRIANGHPLMPRVTALGCALNGVIAAFAVGQPPLEATVAAMAYYGCAGAQAGAETRAPGRFQVAFVDALATLAPADLTQMARITRA